MDLKTQLTDLERAPAARPMRFAQRTSAQKNAALLAMADEVIAQRDAILAANEQDLIRAQANGLAGAMFERLTLNPQRIEAMASGIRKVAELPDPVGETIQQWSQPNGIQISGPGPDWVIGII